MRAANSIGVTILAGMLASVLTGCAAQAKVGRASFEVLGTADPIAAPRRADAGRATETGGRIDYVPVQARAPLAQPEYPAAALKGGGGNCTLFVTFTVDERGRVAQAEPSWNRIRAPGPFADAFLAAAKAALATWKLEPAREVYWKQVPGADDRYLRTETVAERVEVKFVFDAERAGR